MDGYMPLAGRRRAVEIVFAAIILLTAGAIASDIVEVQLLNRIIDGESVSDAEVDSSDDRQQLFGALQFLMMIPAAIVFIGWLFRAHGNLHWVAPDAVRHKSGWAIGGWFVPILNLWRPFQMVSDVWRGARGVNFGALVIGWWSLWIGSTVASWIAGGQRSDADPETILQGTYWLVATDAMSLVSAILVVLIVRRATEGLDGRRDEAEPPTVPERPEAADTEPSPA
jgi:Domain of unknown function (DUF4328)